MRSLTAAMPVSMETISIAVDGAERKCGHWPVGGLLSCHGFPIGTHTGSSAGPQSAGDRGREPASAVGFPAARLGLAWFNRRKEGGDPVTLSPTVICEVVPS